MALSKRGGVWWYEFVYLTGIAIAVNHKGDAAVVSLDDVYRKAARTFRVQENNITQAAY